MSSHTHIRTIVGLVAAGLAALVATSSLSSAWAAADIGGDIDM